MWPFQTMWTWVVWKKMQVSSLSSSPRLTTLRGGEISGGFICFYSYPEIFLYSEIFECGKILYLYSVPFNHPSNFCLSTAIYQLYLSNLDRRLFVVLANYQCFMPKLIFQGGAKVVLLLFTFFFLLTLVLLYLYKYCTVETNSYTMWQYTLWHCTS